MVQTDNYHSLKCIHIKHAINISMNNVSHGFSFTIQRWHNLCYCTHIDLFRVFLCKENKNRQSHLLRIGMQYCIFFACLFLNGFLTLTVEEVKGIARLLVIPALVLCYIFAPVQKNKKGIRLAIFALFLYMLFWSALYILYYYSEM